MPFVKSIARVIAAVAALIALASVGTDAHAARVPSGFSHRVVASGFTSPTAMAITPDGRVLVTQQNGLVRVIRNDVLLPMPFHRVDADATNERGLLGVAIDPAFVTNHFVYLYYTARTPVPHNQILRVTEHDDVAVPGSEQVILDLPPVPAATKWHMGGALRFGADRELYVAVGNHEDNAQPFESANSQNLSNPFGKILRIHADGSVPSDNPFFGVEGAYQAIWAYGLRNPFTFDIQPGTGLTYINDVGQSTWEEINRGRPGANFGWPAAEGARQDSRFIDPEYTYSHDEGCSIVGASFYDPVTLQFPARFLGQFFFADFCKGWIRTLEPFTHTVSTFATDLSFPVNLQVALDGSLYYLARNQQTGTPNPAGGTVGKIVYTGSSAPRITLQPLSQMVVVGDPVTFVVAADDADSLQWQRDGVDIPGATSDRYTVVATTAADSGARFRALASSAHGSTASSEAVLTTTTNHWPAAFIDGPLLDSSYAAGDVIDFSGHGIDPEDGPLADGAFTWQIDFQHETHAHPFVAPRTGSSSGWFTIPAADAVDANVWYRIYLTVRDSLGFEHTTTRDLYPRTSIGDLTPSVPPRNGWGPIEPHRSNGEQGANDGRTISLDGVPYARGLGVHAPSDVLYDLGGACTGQFIADVGVDDEARAGTVTFEVWLDGEQVFDSGLVHGGDLKKPIAVSIDGAYQLELVVTDGGDGAAYDHADWAGARVTGCP